MFAGARDEEYYKKGDKKPPSERMPKDNLPKKIMEQISHSNGTKGEGQTVNMTV